jgi:MSHA pilin protein MshC
VRHARQTALECHRPPAGGRRVASPHQAGFTLVELVVVMVLIAVITAVSAARFADREPFAVQGAADQLVSGLRLAQATAIARRAPVFVGLATSPASLTVCLDAGCTQTLPTPAGDAVWLADATDLRLSTAASFSFSPRGDTSLASTLQLRVLSADGSRSSPLITVEAGSGNVHAP